MMLTSTMNRPYSRSRYQRNILKISTFGILFQSLLHLKGNWYKTCLFGVEVWLQNSAFMRFKFKFNAQWINQLSYTSIIPQYPSFIIPCDIGFKFGIWLLPGKGITPIINYVTEGDITQEISILSVQFPNQNILYSSLIALTAHCCLCVTFDQTVSDVRIVMVFNAAFNNFSVIS